MTEREKHLKRLPTLTGAALDQALGDAHHKLRQSFSDQREAEEELKALGKDYWKPGGIMDETQLDRNQALLDEFAGKALMAMLNSPQTIMEDDYERAARYSYRFAQAMMKERERLNTPKSDV